MPSFKKTHYNTASTCEWTKRKRTIVGKYKLLQFFLMLADKVEVFLLSMPVEWSFTQLELFWRPLCSNKIPLQLDLLAVITLKSDRTSVTREAPPQ